MASLADQRVEEERRLIAHELHDEFGQSVTAIRSLALAIAAQGGARDPATGEAARLISDEAARLYDAMHSLIPRLAPLSLDALGLSATIENLVRDWQRRHPSISIDVRHRLPADLGPAVTLAIYRVVQEGLTNALRHAQPSHVDIAVESDAQRIHVSVADDGVGLPADWARPGHYGLRGLADRVAQFGGTLNVQQSERARRACCRPTSRSRCRRDPRAAGRRSCGGTHGLSTAAAVDPGFVGGRRGGLRRGGLQAVRGALPGRRGHGHRDARAWADSRPCAASAPTIPAPAC